MESYDCASILNKQEGKRGHSNETGLSQLGVLFSGLNVGSVII